MDLARHEEYVSPFTARYVSPEMSRLFSPQFKVSTFRKLWTALAQAERKLGLAITDQQIEELKQHIDHIDFAVIHSYEQRFRHDVMAHIHAYADLCPTAKPIIHLGATSSYVTDNSDLIQLKAALTLLLHKQVQAIRHLASFAKTFAEAPCLAYTHFQPAQPTTIGKRACLWLQDLLLDAKELERAINTLPFLGAKGATGTQASFLALLDNDSLKVKELETLIAAQFGFTKVIPIASQTYTRKIDLQILNLLESFGASIHKMATDIRLLAHEGEITESFDDEQVGSSAMPYKRNPIYAERICGLARFVMSLAQNGAYTTATQWLERSLDDSSNRRLTIPEAFLGTDAILNTLLHLLTHLHVDRNKALSHLEAQIPHLAMEPLLMAAAKRGEDRQAVHETLRRLSGKPIDQIVKELNLDPKQFHPQALTGLASKQVHDYLDTEVDSFLKIYAHIGDSYTHVAI